MKNGNLYQKLRSARKDFNVVTLKRNEIQLAMIRELEEATEKATQPIREKYEPILKAIEAENSGKKDILYDVAHKYHDYSQFRTPYITDIVAVLLTYIEGEKYIPYRNFKNLKISEGSLIIKEEVNKQYDELDYDTLDKLYKNGDLVFLDRNISNIVEFYDFVGEPNYRLGKFNYLYEFVNRLIQYRIDNDKRLITDVTMEDLYSFMCNFISTHPDLAQKNKNKREQMLMVKSEEEPVIKGCKKLEITLKK